MAEPQNPTPMEPGDSVQPAPPVQPDIPVEPEVAAREEAERAEAERAAAASPGRGRRVALLSLRLVAGTVAVVAAAATIAAVGLVPVPEFGIGLPSTTVTPVPADQLRTCAGSALRLGDETGANADKPAAIGIPSVHAGSVGAELERSRIDASDAGNGGSTAAPAVLKIPSADDAAVAGAQSQKVDVRDFRGFDVASCAEPSGSIWLVGGATTTGRTSILTLSNPTPVTAQVSLEIWGEEGAVEAPGMTGIDVPAGAQRVLSLAGFAPGLLSPVVHVEARGGQVVAYLQQSIVRGLDATGMDLLGASPDPATEQTFPGVQVFDSVGTNRALSLDDWDDVAPIVRIFNPGTEATEVTVSVTPIDPAIEGTSFPVQAEPGVVTEVGMDSGAEVDSGVALADGIYTVTMSADQPFVGGVRTSAAADIGPVGTEGIVPAPASDFAWYTGAPELTGDALFEVADGPAPKLVAVNPTSADVTVTLDSQGAGEDLTLDVPAGGAASLTVSQSASYLLTGATGLYAAVTYAADDAMGAYAIASPRPVSGPIVIRP